MPIETANPRERALENMHAKNKLRLRKLAMDVLGMTKEPKEPEESK